MVRHFKDRIVGRSFSANEWLIPDHGAHIV
jgi:hypothetical protein